MKLIRGILNRPTSTFMVILAVVVFGVSSLTGMSMEYMPDMDMPVELVMVTWPGADADSIERLVTEEVEDECETLSDVNTITSIASDNYTMVMIQYEYGTDIDEAYDDLKVAMDGLAASLPDDCEDPMILEISADAMATMTVSATAPEGTDIQSYIDDTVVPDLQSIGGVAQVEAMGASDEYLQIIVDETKMAQYGLTFSSIGAAITAADFDMPVGNVTIGSQDLALTADGNIDIGQSLNIQNVPLQTSTGQTIRLGDVTSYIGLTHEEAESISRYNGSQSILLSVTAQNSAPTMEVCSDVLDTLNTYAETDGIDFQVIYSEADSIRDSLSEVLNTLITGVILTMIVLFIFFGDIRASLIVGFSMPLSILLSMILLNFAGFDFDMMVGTSLVVAIGMIVDNSIVILESCMRWREQGLDFKEAAVQGTSEMLMSCLGGTITTVVVYIPLAMAQGMMGQMSRPLSCTIALTMLSSLLCAVTVVPMVFTVAKPTPKKDLPINKALGKLTVFYRKTIPGLLQKPGKVVLVAVAALLAALLLASQMEFVLFNNNYDGSITVDVDFRSGTMLEVMDERIRPMEEMLLADERFENVTLSISSDSASFTAYAADDCDRTSEEAVEEYTKAFSDLAGMDITVSPSGGSSISSLMSSGNSVAVSLSSDDMDSLREGANLLAEAVQTVPGVLKVSNDFAQERLQGRIVVDAQLATAVGMTQATVAMQANYLLNGSTVASIDYGDQEYDVTLEYPAEKYETLASVMDQPFMTPTGAQITLSDIAEIEYTNSLPTIQRENGLFVSSVTATTTDSAKYTAEEAIDELLTQLDFPEGVGEAETTLDRTTNEEIGNIGSALLTAIFLVFLVMAIQFDSPRLSLMVMLCIPFSLIGSFLLEFLRGEAMSIMGLMGFLMLMGIAVNNGIYLVDGTNELRKTMPLGDALLEAGVTRLRPILMTTLTTVISMVPMMFSSDSGMSMMNEMAYIIVGGLIASTILAMFLMPPFYLLIRRENVDGSKKPPLFLKHKGGNGDNVNDIEATQPAFK